MNIHNLKSEEEMFPGDKSISPMPWDNQEESSSNIGSEYIHPENGRSG
jgi:hypothetical protein